jgi:hypothetical protein
MIRRKGYGLNKGQGYKNLVSLDPFVHSMSAKGVKSFTPQQIVYDFKKDKYKFGTMQTSKKKGLIKELARKVVDGAKWAYEWEKEHLPKQEQWVKDEYNKAKDEVIKLKNEWDENKKEKEFEKKGLEVVDLQKKQDLADVRDELDTNDDGVQDISMSQLEIANKNIVKGLDTIDTDKNGIPDHREAKFTDISSIKVPVPAPHTMTNAPCPPCAESEHEIVKQENAFHKIKDIVDKGYAKGEAYLHERQEEEHNIEDMNDAELMKNAVRKKSGLFLFGGNRWENELIRRETEKVKLAHELKQIRQKAYENLPKDGERRDAFDFLVPKSDNSKAKLPAIPNPLEGLFK